MPSETPAHERLRYRPLPEFMDRQVTIPEFDQIEGSLLREFASALPAPFILESERSHMAMLMAKYGAFDLTFSSPAHVLSATDAITWAGLQKLKLAVGEGTLAEEFEWVERGLADDKCFLRIFLTWAPPAVAMDLRNAWVRAQMAKGVPGRQANDEVLDYLADHIAERFPLTLTIDDACLTNSRFIWAESHFYL